MSFGGGFYPFKKHILTKRYAQLARRFHSVCVEFRVI